MEVGEIKECAKVVWIGVFWEEVSFLSETEGITKSNWSQWCHQIILAMNTGQYEFP